MSSLSQNSIAEFKRLDSDLDNIDFAIDKLPIFSHLRARRALGRRKEELVDATVSKIREYYVEALEYDLEQAIAIYKTESFRHSQKTMDDLDNEILVSKKNSVLQLQRDMHTSILELAMQMDDIYKNIETKEQNGEISSGVAQYTINTLKPLFEESTQMIIDSMKHAIRKQRDMVEQTMRGVAK